MFSWSNWFDLPVSTNLLLFYFVLCGFVRCPRGFIGQRCETRDRSVTGRSSQDESQTGIKLLIVIIIIFMYTL